MTSGERLGTAAVTSTLLGLRASRQSLGLADPLVELRLEILGTTEPLGLELATSAAAGCFGARGEILWSRGGRRNEAVLHCFSSPPDLQLSVKIVESPP
jgi:hypothetical protein